MVDNVHRGGMGAVALKRMQNEGINTDEMWAQNLATKGLTYSKAWFIAKITEYTTLLDTL